LKNKTENAFQKSDLRPQFKNENLSKNVGVHPK